MFAHAPVHRDFTTAHRCAVGINLLHQLVRRDGFRQGGQLGSQAFPLSHRNGGVARIGPFFAQERHPVHRVLALEVRQHRIERVFAGVQRRTRGLDHVVAQRVAETLRGQLVGIQLAGAGVLGNFLVHQRLGQRRGVLLVVAEFAEADDVHHHVFLEFHAVFQRDLGRQHHGFGVIPVHVQNRGFDHLHHVRAVQRGAAVARVTGGEANLVVDDDMHRAAGGVTPGFSQRQRFHDHTLTGKRRVAVHQHGQHLLAFGVSAAVHAGTHRAFDHRVHNFQV